MGARSAVSASRIRSADALYVSQPTLIQAAALMTMAVPVVAVVVTGVEK